MKKNRQFLLLLTALFLLLPFSVKAEDYISINAVKCPVVGQKSTNVGGNTQYTNRYEERWVNATDHKVMGENDKFEANKLYYYEYGYLMKNENHGKYLSYPNLNMENCAYSFGGVGMGYDSSDEEPRFLRSAMAFFTGDFENFSPINDNLKFDVDAPTLGGNPVSIKANSKYTINSQKWYNVTDGVEMKSSDTFAANKKYKLVVNYSTLYLENDIFYNFNNNQYYLGTSWYYEGEIEHIGQDIVSAYFYFGNKDDLEIDATVTLSGDKAPVAGKKIEDFTVTTNFDSTYMNSYWSIAIKEGNTTTYEPITDPNAVFEVGKEYVYNIGIDIMEPGTAFKTFTVTNNNKNKNFVTEDSYNSDYGYSYYHAKYVILPDGKTFGILNEYSNILYPTHMTPLEIYPEDQATDSYTWSSSNEDVATVDDFGWVTGVAPGNVTITAENSKGETATYDLVVGVPVEKVTINKTTLTLHVGEVETLTAEVTPANATEKEVNWSVYSEGPIDYSNLPINVQYDTGRITALRPGTIKVQAYTPSGAVGICEVTVVDGAAVLATGISLNKTKETIEVGQDFTLNATITPNNTTNKTVTWESSDTRIAVVDENGKVTGLEPGEVTITARTSNDKRATCLVKVKTNYNVTCYDEDGETVLKETKQYESGTSAANIDRPNEVKDGKVATWYKEKTFENRFFFTGTINENLDLYAKWEDIRPSLKTDLASIDYGEVDQGFDKIVSRNVVLTNNGNVPISISITNPTGDGPFGSLAFPNDTVLDPGEELEVTLIANPSSSFSNIPGTYTGNYVFQGTYVDDINKKVTVQVEARVVINKLPMHVAYTTHVQSIGWQDYVRDGAMAGTRGRSLRLEATKILLEHQDYPGNIEYRTHVQDYGWMDYVANGTMSGTSHESKRLEAIQIRLTGEMAEHFDIYYRVHAQTFGWMGWAKNDETAGSAHYSYRLEGLEVVLVPKGEEPPARDDTRTQEAFKDRNEVSKITLNKDTLSIEEGEEETLVATIDPENATDKTLTWTSDNEDSVTVDKNGKVKAVGTGTATVTVKSKNGKKATCNVNVLPPIPGVKYTTHVQEVGWQEYVSNGTMAGTSGRSLRLEGIKIKLKNVPYDGGIEYRTHVQDIGWMDFVADDTMSGTSHQSKRLEAIEIRLTGELANHFDIYYRVHAQNLGWMGWAKNGEQSGSAHYSYRLEGIEIVLVDKGENPPARDNTRTEASFVDKNAQ